jgi:transcriptional regulator with XRE-family HTH domain
MPKSPGKPTKPASPSETFAKELGRTRESKRITQQQLCERLEEMGVRIDRTAVGKIETGKRSVTVDELFALAAALRVSPLTLVIPRADPMMRVTPKYEVPSGEVQQWVRGIRFQFPDENESADLRYFYEESRTDGEAAAYRQHPNLRTIAEIVGGMLAAAIADANGSPYPSPTPPSVSYTRLLVNLGFWAQREWSDLGGTGHVGYLATPAAKEAAVKELTDRIYERLEKEGD